MRRKVLLMSPLMSYKDRWGQYYKGAGDTFPVGIGSIAGYLEMHDVQADVLEPDIQGMDSEAFQRHLEASGYDVIGVSAFTTNIAFAYETTRLIKSVNPDIRTVIGGAHPTIFPEQTLMECPEIDFLITHEGEKPFLQLVRALGDQVSIGDVPNLYFKDQGTVISTGKHCEWLNLDDLPLFPYHKFDMTKYVPAPSLRKVLPTFNYMAQRGCPHSCSFCDTRTHGKKVRYRSVDKVLNDIETLIKDYGLKGLIFEGSNFTASASWVESVCRGMIDRGLDISWYCMGRADFDIGLLPLMKEAGLWCMSFGIESANDWTLAKMNKRINASQVERTLKMVRLLGVRAVGSFIIGYPGEDVKDVLRTISYACSLDLDVAVFFIPVPFPGTKLFEDAFKDGGIKKNLHWSDYSAWLDHNRPIYANPLLEGKHTDLYNYAFRKFYVRPKFLGRQLTSIRSWEDVGRLTRGLKSISGLLMKTIRPQRFFTS